MCWRHAPDEYAAIHFHDDDIVDCRWPATHEWTVPSGFVSGSYALMLEAGDAKENIPFFVVPPVGKPRAKIAVLMSTFTYVIYQNNARWEWLTDPEWRKAWQAHTEAWNGYPHYPGNHPEFGWQAFGGNVKQTGAVIRTEVLDSFRMRFYVAPKGLWLTLDAGNIDSVEFNAKTDRKSVV